MKKYDVVAVGEVLIDFTPDGNSKKGMALYECNPGGAVANVLAAVNRFGGNTAFIGKVGDDSFGHFLSDTLVSYGIDTKGLLFDRKIPTTLAFVTLDEKGDRSFSFYRKPGADVMLDWAEIDKTTLENTKIFHFGSVSLTDDPAYTATLEAAKYAKSKGAIISYDPNYRPLLWDSAELAVERMAEGLSIADIIKVSDEELKLLTGESDLDKGAKKLFEYGTSLVFISMGAKGSYYCNKNGSRFMYTYDVKTVDTTGAGDAFLGAILFRLKDKTLDEIADLSTDELDDILDFANASGSLTTTKTGAAPSIPNLDEIAQCRKSVGKLK